MPEGRQAVVTTITIIGAVIGFLALMEPSIPSTEATKKLNDAKKAAQIMEGVLKSAAKIKEAKEKNAQIGKFSGLQTVLINDINEAREWLAKVPIDDKKLNKELLSYDSELDSLANLMKQNSKKMMSQFE